MQFPLQCFSALLRFPATTKKNIRIEFNFFYCEKLKLKNPRREIQLYFDGYFFVASEWIALKP